MFSRCRFEKDRFPRLKGYLCQNGESQMKNRIRQRENSRRKHREEMLDKRNACGVKDLTAYNAVLQIKTNGQAVITLR